MRALWFATTLAIICVAARSAQVPLPIYDRDPRHLWNRLYRAIAVRTEGAVDYGEDNGEPYHDAFDDPKRLAAILDEFLDKHGEGRASGDLRRALLQNDVWAAFDLATSPEVGASGVLLRRRLARVIEQLRLKSSQISGLPDNYAQAVKSAAFATDFDPEHTDRAFLPPDLLDPKGRWVEVGEDGLGAVAPFHVEMLSGRSVFSFHPLPGRSPGDAIVSGNSQPVSHALGAQSTGYRYEVPGPCQGAIAPAASQSGDSTIPAGDDRGARAADDGHQ
jgi:hypothetical protein